MNRIVILLGSQNHGSGAERVLEYLLAGAVSRRDEICLLSPPSSSVRGVAQDLGYEWMAWEADDDALGENLKALRRLAGKDRGSFGNLVHSWHTRHLEWAWALGKWWRVPSAGTLHDDPSPSHQQFGTARKKIIRVSAAHLDGIVAVSDAVSRRCRDLGWREPITTIRNGLPDAPVVSRETGALRRIGFLATAVAWKGLRLLPELIKRTADLSLEWNLFGPQSDETAPLLEELSRIPAVRYHGRVPLEQALPHIDILLHLSLAFDPYPTVLLEAARAGIPAIASDTGGSAEIVVDGATGFITPAGDLVRIEQAIRQLVADPEMSRAMAAAARCRFEESFGVERMVADYFSFWDRLRSFRHER